MNTNRLTIFLLIGAVLAGLAGWYLSSRYIENSLENYKKEFDQGHEQIKVVVAATDLATGVSINSSNAVLRDMPKAYVHRDAITQEAFGEIAGRQLLYPLSSGDPILSTHVSLSEYRSFSDIIPKGMRAITVPIDSTNSISGFLAPGNYIDLLITLRSGNKPQTTQLLSAVKVIATGQNIDNGLAPTKSYNEITLGVTPLDATRITHALSVGKVTVVLRTLDDIALSKKHTIDINNLIDKRKPARTRKAQDFEVIRGGK